MICPNCGTELSEGDAFCYACGYKIQTKNTFEGERCPSCGQSVESGDEFCATCGTKLHTEEPIPDLGVPVMDTAFAKEGQPEKVCRMCGCRIPASAQICPVCQQPTRYAAQPQARPQYAPARRSTFNWLALIAFICALGVGSIPGCIAGLVLGVMGLKKARVCGSGKGFAVAAIILSAVTLILLAIVFVIGIGAGLASPEGVPFDGEFFY